MARGSAEPQLQQKCNKWSTGAAPMRTWVRMDTELSIDRLESEIAELADEIGRRMARWLGLVAEFDRRGGARQAGFRSTGDWLSWRCAIDPRTARDHVRVARELERLPRVRVAFLAGELSYSKVRAITTAAAHEDESMLLDHARTSSAGQLARTVRALRSASSAGLDVANRARGRRFLQWYWEEDGSLAINGRLPAEEGAAFIDAMETAAEAMHPVVESDASGDAPPQRPPLGARRADALAEVVMSGCPRAQVVLHVDTPALACTAEAVEERAGEACFLEDGPAVPSETARRLACDGELIIARHGDGSALDLGRKRRVVSPALRTSLERRDRTCRFPDCSRRHGLQAHHIDHWSRGGRTDGENLILLCRFHHRVVHEDGFRVYLDCGALKFRRPDGREIADVPVRGDPSPALVAA